MSAGVGWSVLLLPSLLLPLGRASFCGVNGVPFSLEILPSGSPVLGCAQPSCVALAEGDDDSVFETDLSGQYDGYFRDEERSSHLQANKSKSICAGSFDENSCPKKNQWVGGIEFNEDSTEESLFLQCCTFEGLRFSQDVGVTTITAGEAVTGGEVIREGRQISFDVIANVRRVMNTEGGGRITYEVTVRRMNCLPDPPEVQVPYDEDVIAEMERVLAQKTNRPISKEDSDGVSFFLHNKPAKHTHHHSTRVHPVHSSGHRSVFGTPTLSASGHDHSSHSHSSSLPRRQIPYPPSSPVSPLAPSISSGPRYQPISLSAPSSLPSSSSSNAQLVLPSPVSPPPPQGFPVQSSNAIPSNPMLTGMSLSLPSMPSPNSFGMPNLNPFALFSPSQQFNPFGSMPLLSMAAPGLEERPVVVQPRMSSGALSLSSSASSALSPSSSASSALSPSPSLSPPTFPSLFGPFTGTLGKRR